MTEIKTLNRTPMISAAIQMFIPTPLALIFLAWSLIWKVWPSGAPPAT